MGERPVQIVAGADGAGREESAAAAKNVELIAEMHRRQAEMYAGGALAPVADLLSDDIVWRILGEGPIAGEHRGWDAVLRCFSVRRELARRTMRMQPGEVVAAGREVVIQLVDETVAVDGEPSSWRTVGIYRIEHGRVRGAWLVPLDPERFERIWSALDQRAGAAPTDRRWGDPTQFLQRYWSCRGVGRPARPPYSMLAERAKT